MKMLDHLPFELPGWLVALLVKFGPAGLGAAFMAAVDPPRSRKEMFQRAFVAFVCSYLFSDIVADFLHSFKLFAFLDPNKRSHAIAVAGLVGALGWFFWAGVVTWLNRFRVSPVEAVDELKKEIQS